MREWCSCSKEVAFKLPTQSSRVPIRVLESRTKISSEMTFHRKHKNFANYRWGESLNIHLNYSSKGIQLNLAYYQTEPEFQLLMHSLESTYSIEVFLTCLLTSYRLSRSSLCRILDLKIYSRTNRTFPGTLAFESTRNLRRRWSLGRATSTFMASRTSPTRRSATPASTRRCRERESIRSITRYHLYHYRKLGYTWVPKNRALGSIHPKPCVVCLGLDVAAGLGFTAGLGCTGALEFFVDEARYLC